MCFPNRKLLFKKDNQQYLLKLLLSIGDVTMKKNKLKNIFTREELEKMKEQDELEYKALMLDKKLKDYESRRKRGELTDIEKYVIKNFF